MNFGKLSNLYSTLVGFVTQPIKKDDEIKLDVKLKTKKTKKDDDDEEEEEEEEDEDDDDDDDDDEEEEVACKAKKDVKPDGKQKKVEFECTVKDLDPKQVFIGLEILASEAITGIPADKKLRNPHKVDILIKEGKIKNYTAIDTEEVDIPLFNATSIDTKNSALTGIFFINGLLPPKFVLKKKIEFEVLLMTGEKAICTFPKVTADKTEVKIECILQKKLIDKQIIIQQFCALDGYN